MPRYRAELFACRNVPEFDGEVIFAGISSAGEGLPVRAESEPSSPLENMQLSAFRDIPQFDGDVIADGEGIAVRAESDGLDRLR
ncbi:MAG: hypothetical protein LC802_09695 [Acidobacteria bacterium]|nr:hypothetical protein [Acidobacteriota bacterium]